VDQRPELSDAHIFAAPARVRLWPFALDIAAQANVCFAGAVSRLSGRNDGMRLRARTELGRRGRHWDLADPVISFSVIAWPKSAALRLSFVLGRLGGFAANFFHHNHWI
jgi:hypothetical protein